MVFYFDFFQIPKPMGTTKIIIDSTLLYTLLGPMKGITIV